MSDTTRIMDLPDNTNSQNSYSMGGNGMTMGSGNGMTMGNGGVGIPERTRKEENSNFNTSYAPIDIHPNPYGHPPPSIPVVPPAPSQPNYYAPPQQQRLPSRDMANDSTYYTHDEQIQANYIPSLPASTKLTNEYMRQYDEHTEDRIKQHNDKKQRSSRIEELIESGQIPILVSILFFIFHIPVVNHYVFKHLSFLSIYDIDGNFNIYGLILKSILLKQTLRIIKYKIIILNIFSNL